MFLVELAMVQVIENRADFEGRLVAMRDDESRPGHKFATIDVRAVQSVEDFPNLLADSAGRRLDVVLTAEAAASLQPGDTVRCRVRRTGPTTVFGERCSRVGE